MAESGESKNVRDLFINSIRMLAEVIEAKDPYTAGHSRRVTALSMQIASEMGLPRAKVAQIRLAAMLHDVGKVSVECAILNKKGPLTDDEYKHVMEHVRVGRRIIEPIFRGSEVLEIVTHHHEHFDGSGYPDGLEGEAIPIGARVILLADAVDAMGSDRAYRPSLAPARIIAEVKKCARGQFDPQVVDAFFNTPHCRQLLDMCDEEAETGGGEADAHEEVADVAETEADAHEEVVEGAETEADAHEEVVDVAETEADAHEEVVDVAEIEADAHEEVVDVAEIEAKEESGAEDSECPEEPPDEPLYDHKHTIAAIESPKEIKALPLPRPW